MSIMDLYWILATCHIRLPYWFIALVVVAFIILFFILLVIWKKKEQYGRLYRTAHSNLIVSQNEISDVSSKCKTQEEKLVQLIEDGELNKELILEKDRIISDLNRKIEILETSKSESDNKYKISESENLNLLLQLENNKKMTEELKSSITHFQAEIQKIQKEKGKLESQIKKTQGTLTKKNVEMNLLEEKCIKIENSKELLAKEYNEYKSKFIAQSNTYKSEIKNLNLKIKRRNEKIEKLHVYLSEINKHLQTIKEEKTLIEKTLQEIQQKRTNISDNLIEKIAKW